MNMQSVNQLFGILHLRLPRGGGGQTNIPLLPA
jgi:hypothetical protein